MSKKLVKLVKDYREHLNPPYSLRDLPAVVVTLVLLLALPLLVLFALKVQNDRINAIGGSQIVFVNPQTLQPVQSITSPTVGVLLTAPWPIAFTSGGEVAGDSTQDMDMSEFLAKETGGSGSNKDHPGTGGTPKSTSTVGPEAPSPTPIAAITSSILLAQDANFSQNVMTISPVTSNPSLVTYTFSNSNPGTKTLHAKFVSSRGATLTYSNSIQLVSIGSVTPTPIATNNTPTPPPPIGGGIRPYPGAPLCPDSGAAHNNSLFHTLWDSARGCHYDHEHGSNPFTSQVATAFPGIDLRALQCGKEVGHCNPSSPTENEEAHHGGKHGGMKWQVDTSAPQGCNVGFEDGQIAIDAYAVMHHNLGRQDIEFESRQHSGVFLLRQCKQSNPSDKGYMFVGQLIEYGQRVMPYQGRLLLYPNNFQPSYDTPRGPYFTTECFGDGSALGIACRPTFNFGGNNLSIWTSKPTGGPSGGPRPPTSTIAGLLFRSRDSYQRLDVRDLTHPFTWRFVCSSDGGITYNPVGCRYNNSTTTVQELAGRIPAAWDNLAGFDTNPTVGRITAQGFVTRYGTLAPNCTVAGNLDCQPIKMVNAFVGFYSSELSEEKVSNPTPQDTPESDLYFCNGVLCDETSPGAVPSGWIGQNN